MASLVRSRPAFALIAVALVAAIVPLTAGPAAANHGTEAGAVVRSGWPQLTDDPATGGRMSTPIEGSTGSSGWYKHSSPTLGNLDGDPALEIVIGSLDGKVYAYNPDGSRLTGWPRRLDAPSTPTAPINGTPAIGDVDGNGSNDVVIGSDNGWVFAFGAGGQILPGWPQFTGYNADYPSHCSTDACTGVVGSPTLADLDNDGRLEVIVGSFSHKIYVWRADGSVLPGWPRDVWDGVASTAAVGDVDRDGSPDIVIGSDVGNDCGNCQPFGAIARGGLVHVMRVDGTELPGWPQATSGFAWSSPALADLDNDGSLEVISGSGFFPSNEPRGRSLYAWRGDGSLMWRFDAPNVIIGSPAVADLTGDGYPEIAIGDQSGNMYLLTWYGAAVWSRDGVSAQVPNGNGGYFFGPMLADVTGDGVPEVVASDANWRVKAWTVSGDRVLDTSTRFTMWNSPAIGDLDGDGTNEVVMGSARADGAGPTLPEQGGRGELWVLNTNGRGGLAWPQHQSRVRTNDGFLAYGSGFRGGVRTAVGNFTDDPGDEIATAAGPGGGPHVRVWSTAGGRPRLVAEWFAYGATFSAGVSVAAANVDGTGLDELVTTPGPTGGPHVRVWSVAGRAATLRAEWFAYDAGFTGGISAGAGNIRPDTNGDEIVTGAGPGGGPHVRVWRVSGSTATLTAEWFAYDAGFRGGVNVAAGDTLSSSPGAEVITGAGPGGGPHLRVWGFDNATGPAMLRREWFTYDAAFRGGVRVSTGQVDGSGTEEIVSGAGPGGGPHVRCFVNSTTSLNCSFFAFGAGVTNGVFPSTGALTGRRFAVGLDSGSYPAVSLVP
ncbi:MAG: hypothetical protein QOE35_2342 [Actinomycetota bacterium]